jgi:hypothetical protein
LLNRAFQCLHIKPFETGKVSVEVTRSIRKHLISYFYTHNVSHLNMQNLYIDLMKLDDLDMSSYTTLYIIAKDNPKLIEKWVDIIEDLYIDSKTDKIMKKLYKIIDDEHQRTTIERSMSALIKDIKSVDA